MRGPGYWYHDGQFLEIAGLHISAIIGNPLLYEIAENLIKTIYQKHNEVLGTDGYASEEILMEATKKGWIRVGRYLNPVDHWQIQVDDYMKREKDIHNLIQQLVNDLKVMKDDSKIAISSIIGEKVYLYKYISGGIDSFLQREYQI
jgi:hypothetical protein